MTASSPFFDIGSGVGSGTACPATRYGRVSLEGVWALVSISSRLTSPARENKMYKPEVTIGIITKSSSFARQKRIYYGPRGIERRVKRCCSDNPVCPFPSRCDQEHTKFVNATHNPKEPPEKEYERPHPSVIETYHFSGPRAITHGDMVRC